MRLSILVDLVRTLSRHEGQRDFVVPYMEAMRRAYVARATLIVEVRGSGGPEWRPTHFSDERGVPILDVGAGTYLEGTTAWHRGGLVGEIVAETLPTTRTPMEVRPDDPLAEALAPFRSCFGVPLFEDGVARNWVLLLDRREIAFTDAEVEGFLLRANLLGTAQRAVDLTRDLRQANARIEGEIERIAAIQRALLPETLPEVPGLELSGSFATFDRAGGDLYDVFPRADGSYGILVADASGHGPAAAVVIAMVHALLHARPEDESGPAAILGYLSDHLAAKRIEASFVTAFLAVYEPESRKLTYARAGHPPPLLRTPGGHVQALEEAGGVPLGIFPERGYAEATVQLRSGQTLVFYTDGITETADRDGRMFGVPGLEAALEACTEQEPLCIIKHVTAAVREYEAGRRPSDDQTLLAARVL